MGIDPFLKENMKIVKPRGIILLKENIDGAEEISEPATKKKSHPISCKKLTTFSMRKLNFYY